MAAITAPPQRKQGPGLALAVAMHVVVIGLLSVQWTAGDRRFDNPPMEVDLIAETAPESTAPVISETPPAARLGEEDADDIAAPPEPAPPPPAPPQPDPRPEPVVRETPAPAPRQVKRPTPEPVRKQPPAEKKVVPPKAAPKAVTPPAKAAPKTQPKAATPPAKATPKAPPATKQTTRPTGRLDGIVDGLSKSQPKAPASKGAPAAATAAQVKRSIDVSIKAAVAPRWDRCRVSGVDVDQLVTTVKFRLSQSGALTSFSSVTTAGVNDSNKPQVPIHQECAKKAIQLASPFDLDPENYEYWKEYTLHLEKK